MDKKTNKIIENNFLALAGTIILIIGYIVNTKYYKNYNININQYLEISETLTLFFSYSLDDILLWSYTIFIILLEKDRLSSSELYKNFIESDTLKLKLKNLVKFHFAFIILIFIIILTAIIFNEPLNWKLILPLFLLTTINFFYRSSLYHNKDKFSLNRIFYIKVLYWILTINYVSDYYVTYKIKSHNLHKIKFIAVFNNGDTIKSNANNYYIGKCRNYFFLYNKKDTCVDVVPTSNLKFLKIYQE